MKPNTPKSVFIIRPDAMGDLVLFSPTLLALRSQWPNTRIQVLIRGAYKEIAQLLVPNVEWLFTDIDPFLVNPLEAKDQITQLRSLVKESTPDLIVAACPRRNWIDMVIASAAPDARHVAFVTKERDPYFGLQLKWAMPQGEALEYKEVAPALKSDQDWVRAFGLVNYLTGETSVQTAPSLQASSANLAASEAVLAAINFKVGEYIVCAAAGSANVSIKGWSLEKYAETIAELSSKHHLKFLLIGHESEKTVLEKVKRLSGISSTEVWVGKEGKLGVLVGLIAHAKIYLGNDTGAMHIAAALQKPTVALFGGGTWPRFKPALKRGITLINPLPCFGCDWDCPFGDAPCVKAISTHDAIVAVQDLLVEGKVTSSEVREVNSYPKFVTEMMGRSAAEAKQRSALHLKREQTLIETAMLAAEKDSEIEMLKKETDVKDSEIAMLKKETDVKDSEIAMLKKDSNEKLTEISSISQQAKNKDALIQEIHSAHGERLKDIDGFLKSLAEKEAMIKILHNTCEERLSLILRLELELKQLKSVLERRK